MVSLWYGYYRAGNIVCKCFSSVHLGLDIMISGENERQFTLIINIRMIDSCRIGNL